MLLTLFIALFSLFIITGFNFLFWTTVGLIRFITERLEARRVHIIYEYNKYKVQDVAVLIPAHNEELVLGRTLAAILKIVTPGQVYVVSDHSTDNTLAICEKHNINYIETPSNIGKARALAFALKEFNIFNEYKLALFNDADIEIDKNYFKYALPKFNDPDIAAVAAHGSPRIKNYTFWQAFLIAYRVKTWALLQLGMRYGQTWKYTNFSFIVPGAFSTYRTDVLQKIKIDAPGLMIEDFNMTFELHKKKLGKIAYSPKIIGVHQDPYTLTDYIKQVERWDIGFFQTVKRHGIWLSTFWLLTTIYYLELYINAFLFSFTPFVIGLLIINHFEPIYLWFIPWPISVLSLIVGIIILDYMSTMVTVFIEKKPMLLLFGLGFFFMRYLDAIILLYSPVLAFTRKSSGTWKSPKRV